MSQMSADDCPKIVNPCDCIAREKSYAVDNVPPEYTEPGWGCDDLREQRELTDQLDKMLSTRSEVAKVLVRDMGTPPAAALCMHPLFNEASPGDTSTSAIYVADWSNGPVVASTHSNIEAGHDADSSNNAGPSWTDTLQARLLADSSWLWESIDIYVGLGGSRLQQTPLIGREPCLPAPVDRCKIPRTAFKGQLNPPIVYKCSTGKSKSRGELMLAGDCDDSIEAEELSPLRKSACVGDSDDCVDAEGLSPLRQSMSVAIGKNSPLTPLRKCVSVGIGQDSPRVASAERRTSVSVGIGQDSPLMVSSQTGPEMSPVTSATEAPRNSELQALLQKANTVQHHLKMFLHPHQDDTKSQELKTVTNVKAFVKKGQIYLKEMKDLQSFPDRCVPKEVKEFAQKFLTEHSELQELLAKYRAGTTGDTQLSMVNETSHMQFSPPENAANLVQALLVNATSQEQPLGCLGQALLMSANSQEQPTLVDTSSLTQLSSVCASSPEPPSPLETPTIVEPLLVNHWEINTQSSAAVNAPSPAQPSPVQAASHAQPPPIMPRRSTKPTSSHLLRPSSRGATTKAAPDPLQGSGLSWGRSGGKWQAQPRQEPQPSQTSTPASAPRKGKASSDKENCRGGNGANRLSTLKATFEVKPVVSTAKAGRGSRPTMGSIQKVLEPGSKGGVETAQEVKMEDFVVEDLHAASPGRLARPFRH